MQGVPDPGSAAAAIEFRAVTKRYPGREAPAVRELSLSVPAGEICVLIGPSGSGKTTAMKMVNRLIDITEGDITIGGQSVRSLDLTELRRGIGYVFQQIGLFPHMSVEDNIGTVPRLLGLGQAAHPRPRRRTARARRARAERRQALSRASSRAASASASAWPARWPPTSRSCSWTSRSARSTRSPATGCRTTSCACTPRSARRSSSSRTTSTRPSRWATGSPSSRTASSSSTGRPTRSSPARPTSSSPTSWAPTAASSACCCASWATSSSRPRPTASAMSCRRSTRTRACATRCR